MSDLVNLEGFNGEVSALRQHLGAIESLIAQRMGDTPLGPLSPHPVPGAVRDGASSSSPGSPGTAPFNEPDTLITSALTGLNHAVEELEVAGEELCGQNNELIASSEVIQVERQRYRELFELGPDGYLVTDAVGTIEEGNQAAVEMLNLKHKMLLGKPLAVFVSLEDRAKFRNEIIELHRSGTRRRWTVCLEPRNAKPFYAELSVVRREGLDTRKVRLLWLMRDVTAIHLAREAVDDLNLGLEARVRERTSELEKANSRLYALEQVNNATLAYLTVDALLNEILERIAEAFQADETAIYLLDRDPAGERSAGSSGGRSIVLRASRGIPHLADTARIPLGSGETMASVVGPLPAIILNTDAEPSRPTPPTECHSVMRAPLVVSGETIGLLHVGSLAWCEFAADDLRLLQAFADRAALAIAEANARELEQRVETRALEAEKRMHSRALLGKPLRNLIMDHNRDSANALGELLDSMGHETCIDYSFANGIARARPFNPNVAICCVDHPDGDGFQTAAALRSKQKGPGFLVLAVSGYDRDADRKQAVECGFDAYLTKPLDLEMLRTLLASQTLVVRRALPGPGRSMALTNPGLLALMNSCLLDDNKSGAALRALLKR